MKTVPLTVRLEGSPTVRPTAKRIFSPFDCEISVDSLCRCLDDVIVATDDPLDRQTVKMSRSSPAVRVAIGDSLECEGSLR